MALPLYLALTAAEFQNSSSLPDRVAWMACHYSPYGLALSNMPASLPAGSMLILNDRTPPCGHDPELITQQLCELVEKFHCSSVLLDFQRPGFLENEAVAKAAAALPCPVGVSELYAKGLDCPVFLPPVPLTTPISDYLSPWQGREVWLEAAINGETFTVTETESICMPLIFAEPQGADFCDHQLHCHYQIRTYDDHIDFALLRTREDLHILLQDVEKLAVTAAIGLWQELN